MLYKLLKTKSKYDKLEPLKFEDFSAFGHLEKDLEQLIANNLLDVLYEEASLMPVFQERSRQAEADVYALNEKGELVIFELKRGSAGEDAVQQALRYAQEAGQWTYAVLQEKYSTYMNKDVDLLEAHKEAFNLEHSLHPRDMNRKQHLIVVGSAADDGLVASVEYWKKQGISIDYFPYRVYDINGEKYFEFFALPFDRHQNPSDSKGVLFDTNRSYNEDAVWDMIENHRVAAYGDAKRFIEYVYPDDIVFFSHKNTGIIAAAKVKKGKVKSLDEDTLYRDVEFLTEIPKRSDEIKAMSFGRVSEITGKSFFWARTIKVPYLSKKEAESLLKALVKELR